MLKRRSFLAMLGLAPVAAVTKAAPEPLAAPVAPAIETAAEGIVMANVKMPVKVALTAEQVEAAKFMCMPVWEYAKHLMALKQEGKIEAPVHISADVEAAVTEGGVPSELIARDRLSGLETWKNYFNWKDKIKRKEPVITHEMGDNLKGMKPIEPNVWSNL